MYKICGKVKETEKTSFFNCLFCHTERIFPVQSLSCCRAREGVEKRSVTDVCKALLSSMAQGFAFSAVCMGLLWELVFWELLAAGAPGGTRLHCCRASRWNSTCLPPEQVWPSHCFLQGPLILSLQDGPTGVAGWPGASGCTAGENKGAVSRAKCFTPFSNVLCHCLQYLSHLCAPAMLVSVGGLGA